LSWYLECSRIILQFCVDLLVLGTKGLQIHHFMLYDPPQHDHRIWEGSVGKLQLLQLWDSCESSAHCWLTSKITIYVSTYRRPRFPHLVSRWYYWALVDPILSIIAPVPSLLSILVLNFFTLYYHDYLCLGSKIYSSFIWMSNEACIIKELKNTKIM
jgi:hypothetical protein